MLKNSSIRNAVVTSQSIIFPYSEQVNVFHHSESWNVVSTGERVISLLFILSMSPLFFCLNYLNQDQLIQNLFGQEI